MVYTKIIKTIIFIRDDVKKKLLNGLIIKSTIKAIETAEQVHIFFVESVKIIKLNGISVSI